MAQSRGFLESGLEGRSGVKDDPEDVHPASGERDGLAKAGELPSEPSWAAGMKTIPGPPRRDPGMPGSRRQALLAQHLNGRAA